MTSVICQVNVEKKLILTLWVAAQILGAGQITLNQTPAIRKGSLLIAFVI
jgi:hypothetical protein